jgi:hypothetical protein
MQLIQAGNGDGAVGLQIVNAIGQCGRDISRAEAVADVGASLKTVVRSGAEAVRDREVGSRAADAEPDQGIG